MHIAERQRQGNGGTSAWLRQLDKQRNKRGLGQMGKGILLWLLGVPIPIIIILWLLFH
ncbi:hypothetical protein [Sphingobium aromaticivastans]|uniref:hypothetical protein n=1 Tax=Sphingobium aromaticivastans TaxID=1778665 RepID=UPI00159C2A9D